MNTPNERFPRDAQYVPTSPISTGGFWENLEMIRPVAWVIAVVVFLGTECLFWFTMFQEKKMQEAPLIAKAALMLIPLLPAGYVLLVGYVYVDSKRRGMRYVMWTLLAIFINNFIGIILYFLMRDPLPTPCPHCGHQARGGFSLCPNAARSYCGHAAPATRNWSLAGCVARIAGHRWVNRRRKPGKENPSEGRRVSGLKSLFKWAWKLHRLKPVHLNENHRPECLQEP